MDKNSPLTVVFGVQSNTRPPIIPPKINTAKAFPSACTDFHLRKASPRRVGATVAPALSASGRMKQFHLRLKFEPARRKWGQIAPCAREKPMADLKKILANVWSRKRISKEAHAGRGQKPNENFIK